MRVCPKCGRLEGNDASFCEVDGTGLGAARDVETLPMVACASPWCVGCGARFEDDGEGCCKTCGVRAAPLSSRAALPASVKTRFGLLKVVGYHGDGDLVVATPDGARRLLVFGDREAIETEADALAVEASCFPPVLAQGEEAVVGHYLVLRHDLDGASRICELDVDWNRALAVIRSALDAAAEMQRRGFLWEPADTDLYADKAGRLVSVRARGARKRFVGEPLNAKRVLEALGSALLPVPCVQGTPELVRLLMPRSNFSTAATMSIDKAREVVDRAEEIAARRTTEALAELCDPGLQRHHNEDATAIGQGEGGGVPFAVLVVCDGVSSSTHAEQASAIASRVACDSIVAWATKGACTPKTACDAVLRAIREAHEAVAAAPIAYGDDPPPGTTIVAALVVQRWLTVGWVGDSRAYWIGQNDAELCTRDHSWLNDVVSRGAMSEADAAVSPFAHALTRCLGPLETGCEPFADVHPDVMSMALPGPGHLILCSDGLWNYLPHALAVAEVVRLAGPHADATAVARLLVCHALAAGGGDNVSVAVQTLT